MIVDFMQKMKDKYKPKNSKQWRDITWNYFKICISARIN